MKLNTNVILVDYKFKRNSVKFLYMRMLMGSKRKLSCFFLIIFNGTFKFSIGKNKSLFLIEIVFLRLKVASIKYSCLKPYLFETMARILSKPYSEWKKAIYIYV